MKIEKELRGSSIVIHLSGRLAVNESKELNEVLENDLEGITDLTFDFTELAYISSAGLRSILLAQDIMDKVGGGMRIFHVQPGVLDVLTVAGFCDFMDVEA